MHPEGTCHVIIEMPEHNPGQLGGTMRLGKRQTIFKSDNSKLRQLYGNVNFVEERHRHRYVSALHKVWIFSYNSEASTLILYGICSIMLFHSIHHEGNPFHLSS